MKAIIAIPAQKIRAYSFDELDEKAKEEVRLWLLNGDCLISEAINDIIQYELEKTFNEVEISEWELDYNYRGLSFHGCLKDEKEVISEAFIKLYSDKTARHLLTLYCHKILDINIKIYPIRGRSWNTINTGVDVSINIPYYNLRKEAANLDEDLQQYFQDFINIEENNALLKGEKEYKWLHSDEYVKETCEINKYWFDEKGKPVHHLGKIEILS